MIAETDEFKGAWRAIGRIAPERLSSLRRVATIESIGSSTHIEGAKLSDREVEKLLANNPRIGLQSPKKRQSTFNAMEVIGKRLKVRGGFGRRVLPAELDKCPTPGRIPFLRVSPDPQGSYGARGRDSVFRQPPAPS